MSRVGKKPISLPSGVKINIGDQLQVAERPRFSGSDVDPREPGGQRLDLCRSRQLLSERDPRIGAGQAELDAQETSNTLDRCPQLLA